MADGTNGERRLTVSTEWLGVKPPPIAVRMAIHEPADGKKPATARVRCPSSSAPSVQEWLHAWPAHDVRVARRGPTAIVHARLARHPGRMLPDGCKIRNLELQPSGRAKVKVSGTREALDALAKQVDGSRQRPAGAGAILTARQRRALAVAVEMGYYSLPRPVTLRQMAERLGTSASSLSELLRRAEAALVLAYARSQAWTEPEAAG